MSIPRVTVIIPHYNASKLLEDCLLALRRTLFTDFSTVIVDNGSTDDTIVMLEKSFPEVQVLQSSVNLGFAGGCNLGIRKTHSPYVVLLNNDTEVMPDWLAPMVELAESDPAIGAVQPKLMNFHDRGYFDYSGAAGGEIDIFGYPYARGRLFDTVELDEGQYDQVKQIFWASGAATLLRRSAVETVGLLEEAFFAHMEEIDLNWRLQWAGYRIMALPQCVVYHHEGGTLDKTSLSKMTLNHRNNLLMILRNHSLSTLVWVFPARLVLEGLTFIVSCIKMDWKRAWAVVSGLSGMITHWKVIRTGRRRLKSFRKEQEGAILSRMYRGSVALAYFVGNVRRADQI